ncbi:dethiobiotin synthase [Micrococcus luteus]|uniref:ATP-dependent dethiobiotin synthetase BioD n=1 Tax=Micrococcus luteus TaxID=1270 RepID=UPI0021055288|nr:dethiobiotin synthase [Micrococcus luteus]UTX34835.1 dethiobiotin synthase [Micrococcus luteus]
MSARIEIVTGTDTDVGKTWATAALAVQALTAGERVHVDKPAQTGVRSEEPGDVDVVRGLVAEHVGAGALDRLTVSEGVRLDPAMAPVDAVAQTAAAGRTVPTLPPLAMHLERWARLAVGVDQLLVEGAGGVTVAWTAADEGPVDAVLALRAAGWPAQLCVVARAGLGTQNHTRLTVEHAVARGVVPARILVSGTAEAPDAVEEANLRRLAGLARDHGAVLQAVPRGTLLLSRAS